MEYEYLDSRVTQYKRKNGIKMIDRIHREKRRIHCFRNASQKKVENTKILSFGKGNKGRILEKTC